MVSESHPKPLVIKQEITNYDVAGLICSIIDAVCLSSKEERGKKKMIIDSVQERPDHRY